MSRLKNIVLVGAGGHCTSVIDVIEQERKYSIIGLLDNSNKGVLLDYPILGGDELIPTLIKKDVAFLITIGQIKSVHTRKKIAELLDQCNARLATVISPFAYISKYAKIEKGSVIMHGANVNANAFVGKHCIINTRANIEHGVKVEDFCHISTGAIINGDSSIGQGSFIGSNATVSHSTIVPPDSIVRASTFYK